LNLSIQINMRDGKVSVVLDGLGDQNLSAETMFQWHRAGSEEEKCGFVVKRDSIGLFDWEFISISEVAAELFLWMYVQILARHCGVEEENISYSADGNTSLNRVAFLPPSVDDDDIVQEFPAMQNDLLKIWISYQGEGRLKEEHIERAQDDEILFDFLSLLNVERMFLTSRKEVGES